MAPGQVEVGGVLVTGKRYQVFSMKERTDKGSNDKGTVWVKAGSAWVNRDGSLNVYLDVLPLDGRLHVREAVDKKEAAEPLGAVAGTGVQ
jgi:hypothetical protein